jgi:hypothetical protein
MTVPRICSILGVMMAFASNSRAEHIDTVPYYEVDGQGHFTLSVGSFDMTKSAVYLNDLPPEPIQRNVLVLGGAASPSPFLPGAVVTGDPGWTLPVAARPDDLFGADYPAGTLPVGSGSLSFNVVADPRLGRNLSYWNGIGSPTFGPVPGGETLDITIASPLGVPPTVTLAGESTGKPGFTITNSLFPGFHEHTGSYLWGSSARDGTPDDYATPGFYLYSLQMEVKNGLAFPDNVHAHFVGDSISPTFHILMAVGFNKGGEEPIYGDIIYQYQYDEFGNALLDAQGNPLLLLDALGHPVPELDEFGNPLREIIGTGPFVYAPEMQQAMDWVHANLAPIPEPGCLSLLGLGAALMSFMKRSRTSSITRN